MHTWHLYIYTMCTDLHMYIYVEFVSFVPWTVQLFFIAGLSLVDELMNFVRLHAVALWHPCGWRDVYCPRYRWPIYFHDLAMKMAMFHSKLSNYRKVLYIFVYFFSSWYMCTIYLYSIYMYTYRHIYIYETY
jgi:hypothetical protein